jgi:2-haloacid dehalogenase
MAPRKVDSVVFDLGNVMIPWNPRFLYRKLFNGDEKKVEWFLENICTGEWNETHDAGRAFADGVAELIGRHPEHRELIEAYVGRWDEMLGEPIAENVALARDLKDAGLALYVLSNLSREKYPATRARCPFLEWFDGIVISAHEGVRKPFPGIFEVLVKRYGLAPERTVFIDDSGKNIEASRSLGFLGIKYDSPDQLRTDLKQLGLPQSAGIYPREPRDSSRRYLKT